MPLETNYYNNNLVKARGQVEIHEYACIQSAVWLTVIVNEVVYATSV